MRWGLLSVAGIVLLSGCFGASPGADGGPTAKAFGPPPDPDVLDRARDSRPHPHDYWNGSTEQVLFDRMVYAWGSGQNFWSTFNPPLDAVVIAGTTSFRVLAHWNASNGQKVPAQFYYQPPGEKSMTRVELPHGETLTITIDPKSHDAPHTHKSKWRYGFGGGPQPGADPIGINGTMRVELVRGDQPIPISPSHPDHWNGTSRIKVQDLSGRLQDPVGFPAGLPREAPPRNPAMRIVPPEATELRITFYYNSTSPPPAHYAPILSWSGADNFGVEGRDVPPTESAPNIQNGRFVWRFAVQPRMWDSPYADPSDWSLSFWWNGILIQDRTYFIPRPATMVGDYHLVIDVHRAPLA